MSKELEIWRFAAERLQHDESVMLLVVAESSGSSPGRQGFKMIVAHDEMRGSIGGGVMEVSLVELAKGQNKSKVQRPESKVIEQIHRSKSPSSSGMICSGKQTIIIRKLNKEDLRTVQKIIQYLKNNRLRYLQITESKFQVGWHKRSDFDFNFTVNNPHILEAHVREVARSINGKFAAKVQPDRKTETDISQISTFLYEEKLGFKNKLFIIGGGHCALALSELMSKLDFHISLFDDRSDLNTLAKNEFVHEKKIIESYENIGEHIQSGNNVYVVVMTLGYKFDEIVIKLLIDKNFKYFGVLGSRAKMKTLLKNLETQGFDKEKLARLSTPIGLEINSHTPAEIAVSIAAEIIKVKNSKG